MQINKIKKVLSHELTVSRSLAIGILLICLLGFWSALSFGGAALNYAFVRNIVESWQNDANMQTIEDYQNAADAISSAEFKHSSHPLYADLSGQIDEWGVVAGYESQEKLDDAKQAYLKASKLRPTWPVTWASLAIIKWRKQEFDDEMLHYLELADKFGPQKPEVHVLFSQLGLALYQANHPFYNNIREATQDRVVAGLRHELSREKVLSAINENNALDFACIWSKSRNAYVYNNVISCEE